MSGEDISVYSEPNEIVPIKINDVECTSFKEIAEELLKDKEAGKQFIYKGNLAKYLVKINQDLASEIADKLDDYSANNNLDDGLLYVAYKLCPNLGFMLSDKTTVCSVKDVEEVIRNNPNLILPYLTDISKGFYTYLKVVGLEEISEKLWQLINGSNLNDLIIPKILLAFNENKLTPFKDEINYDISLISFADFEELSENLKTRLLYFIDAGNKTVCAWFELVTGKRISEWRDAIRNINFQKIKVPKLDLFFYFFNGKKLTNLPSDIKDIINLLDSVQVYGFITNIIIDCCYKKFYNSKDYENCSRILDRINENFGGLSRAIDFYLAKNAECCLNCNKYDKALELFLTVQNKNPKEISYFLLGSDAAIKAKEYRKSLEMAEKAISIDSKNCYALFAKGLALYNQKEYKEAISAFALAIDMADSQQFYECKQQSYEYKAEAEERLAEKDRPDFLQKGRNDRAQLNTLFDW